MKGMESLSSASVGSAGSKAFEVDVAGIKDCCTSFACDIAIEKIRRCDDDISGAVDRFFDDLPINRTVDGMADIRPDAAGTLFQRLSFELVSRARNRFEGFMDNLRRMGPEEALSEMGKIFQEVSARTVETALESVLRAQGFGDGSVQSVCDAVANRAMLVFRGEEDGLPSIGRLRAFLSKLQSDIAGVRGFPETVNPPVSARDGIQRFGKRTLREFLLGRPRFDEKELLELIRRDGDLFSGIVVDGFLSESYGAMRCAIGELVNRMLATIEDLLLRAERADVICQTARSALMEDRSLEAIRILAMPYSTRAGAQKDRRDLFDIVFVLPDRSLDAITEREPCGRRILKPIVESREGLSVLVEEGLHAGSGFGNGCERVLERVLADETVPDEKRLGYELATVVRENVFLADGFVDKHFSFLAVLTRNRDYWNAEYERQTGSILQTAQMDEFFYKMIGTPSVSVGYLTRGLPPVDVLKYTIVDTFPPRAKTGMELDRNPSCEVRSRMTVWVPFKVSSTEVPETIRKLGRKPNGDRHFEVKDLGNPASSPFAYYALVETSVVYSRVRNRPVPDPTVPSDPSASLGHSRPFHPFDAFPALEYYREPDVLSKLMETEREDGKTIFDDASILGGLGYVSPWFVRNPAVSAKRWKPWADDPSV